jgi:hypothetical protein
LADGFRTIVAREAMGDRIPGAMAWNLVDPGAKFADVEDAANCVAYLDGLGGIRLAAE